MIMQFFVFCFFVLGWLVLVLLSSDVRFFMMICESVYIVAILSFLVYFWKKVPLKFQISCKIRFCVGQIDGSVFVNMQEGLFIFVFLPKFLNKRPRLTCENNIFLSKILCYVRDHPFSMQQKFSEKLTLLTPWHAHVHVCTRGSEMFVFRKILRTY